jgi:hypothetical protein
MWRVETIHENADDYFHPDLLCNSLGSHHRDRMGFGG